MEAQSNSVRPNGRSLKRVKRPALRLSSCLMMSLNAGMVFGGREPENL